MALEDLTAKQRVFIVEYLHSFNATQAAINAGYSEKTAHSIGHENLKKPEIASAIEEFLTQNAMSAAEVLWHLTNIARGDIAEVVNDSGALSLPKAKELRKSNLIKKVKSKTTYFGGDDNGSETHEEEVEMYDRLKALELLAKYHDLVNKVRIEVDWQVEAIAAIKDGMPYDALASEIGDDLAQQLFKSAGVPVLQSGNAREDQ